MTCNELVTSDLGPPPRLCHGVWLWESVTRVYFVTRKVTSAIHSMFFGIYTGPFLKYELLLISEKTMKCSLFRSPSVVCFYMVRLGIFAHSRNGTLLLTVLLLNIYYF